MCVNYLNIHVLLSLHNKSSQPFSLIHSDIWGLSNLKNIAGQHWFLLLIDTHVSWVLLMKENFETSTFFQQFNLMIQNQFSTSIKILKTDKARDYFNSVLGTYLDSQGIVHQSSCVLSLNRMDSLSIKINSSLILDISLLFTQIVPKYFWGDDVLTATCLINRMPSRVLHYELPFNLLRPHSLLHT